MKVYAIGHIAIKDAKKWEAYKSQVPQSLEGFDAKIVLRGKTVENLDGSDDYTDIVVLEFATHQEAKNWYKSANYQKLIALRKEAAHVVLKIYKAMK